MVNIFFFQNSKIFLDMALKTIVLDVSWASSGLFSLKQIFWHLDFIVSSIHLDAILSWQIFSTNFVGKFFWQVFSKKKYFLVVVLRVTIMVNKFFFRNSKKKFRSGLKKHCSGHFLNWLGSFFITASILTHRFHSQ